MAKKKIEVQAELTQTEEQSVSVDLATAVMSVDDLPAEESPAKDVEIAPSMDEPEWSDYVMRQFKENELDASGSPLLTGLRRVTRKLLGPLLESKGRVVQAPTFLPGMQRSQPAVAEHTIKILKTFVENDAMPAYTVEVTATADCHEGNAPQHESSRFLTAMAETRAESRAYRKLLQLGVVAAEEKSSIPDLGPPPDGKINDSQVNFFNIICSRCNINVLKFINSGRGKYQSVYDIPFETAQLMSEKLSSYQNNLSSIPESIKGYDINWLTERGSCQ